MSLPSSVAHGIEVHECSHVVIFGTAEKKNSPSATATKDKLCYWESYFKISCDFT